jgi:hypothetical protein
MEDILAKSIKLFILKEIFDPKAVRGRLLRSQETSNRVRQYPLGVVAFNTYRAIIVCVMGYVIG